MSRVRQVVEDGCNAFFMVLLWLILAIVKLALVVAVVGLVGIVIFCYIDTMLQGPLFMQLICGGTMILAIAVCACHKWGARLYHNLWLSDSVWWRCNKRQNPNNVANTTSPTQHATHDSGTDDQDVYIEIH